MASSIEVVLSNTKNIESLLTKKFSPVGKGLIEKVKSIEYNLPESLVKDIKKIGRIRNKFAHESNFSMSENEILDFVILSNEVLLRISDIESFVPDFKPKLTIQTAVSSDNSSEGNALGCFVIML